MRRSAIIILVIFSLLTALACAFTFSFQNLLITYPVTALLYCLAGLLAGFGIRGKKIRAALIFLLPMLLLGINAAFYNPGTIPKIFPFLLFIAGMSFFAGLGLATLIRQKDLKKVLALSLLWLAAMYAITMIYLPFAAVRNYTTELREPFEIKGTLLDTAARPMSWDKMLGKTVLTELMFTHCAPCLMKLPYLEGVIKKMGGDSTFKILVLIDGRLDSFDSFLKFVKKQPKSGIEWGYDTGGKTCAQYVTAGFPTQLIIDKTGDLRQIHAGFNPEEGLIYEKTTLQIIHAIH